MRIFQTTLILLLFFCSTLVGQISFRQASYNQCKATAVSSQLPFVVYVTAKWCLNCKLMEETTFRSQGLKLVVDGKYDTYKIDFDSYAAKDWKTKFPITSVPAFLVFDKNGKMIQRVDKSLTSTQIIELLGNPIATLTKTNTATSTYHYEYAAGPYKNDFYNWTKDSENLKSNSKSFALKEKEETPQIAQKEIALVNTSEEAKTVTSNPKIEEQKLSFYLTPQDVPIVEEFMEGVVKISDDGDAVKLIRKKERKKDSASEKMNEIAKYFYKVSNLYHTKTKIEKTDEPVDFGKKMYRIQFGIFADINDATGLVSELRRQQPHPIFTLHESRAGEPVYRVVVGKFSTYEEADIVKDEIYIKGLQAMVIEI